MNKFWEWMKNNDLADVESIYDIPIECQLYDSHKNPIYWTKQMLIGYMIKYLFSLNFSIKDMMPKIFLQLKGAEINGVYNWLEAKINFINKDK